MKYCSKEFLNDMHKQLLFCQKENELLRLQPKNMKQLESICDVAITYKHIVISNSKI